MQYNGFDFSWMKVTLKFQQAYKLLFRTPYPVELGCPASQKSRE